MLKTVIFVSFLIFSQGFAQTMSRTPTIREPLPPLAFADGTFENGMDRWGFWQMTAGLASFDLSEKEAHSGKKCAHITTRKIAQENWHIQLQMRLFQIEKNAIYRMTFWARGENNAGNFEVVFVKGSPPWSYYTGKKFKPTSQWQKCEIVFTSPATTTDIQMAIQCASQTGDYYFDDVSFVKEGLLDLKEVATDWYEKAPQRIDSLRKSDFSLQVYDKNGSSLQGTLEVHHKRHEFPFGTCLNFYGNADDAKYEEIALKNFNSGVFENAFKWEELEKVEGKPNCKDIEKYLDFSKKYNFPLRGHTLVWGTENYGFDKHWARLKDDASLRNAIKNRIIRDVTMFKGRIKEYDVWNEPIHEPALFMRLGNDILDSAFVWAHCADPEAKLFVNEYSIVSGTDGKIYRDLIIDMLKRNIPVQGIGVQGHFSNLIDPLDIAAKLYYMGETGLPIKVTEFDMDVKGINMSDAEQANQYTKMLTTAFSHPSVTGFLFWGFWDNRHWRPGAGLYDKDLKPKPVADSIYKLIHSTWSTNDTLKSDSSGKFQFRGFYGDYEIVFRDKAGKTSKYNVAFLKKDKETKKLVKM